MRALLIDSAAQEVREVEWTGKLEEMRAFVGGWIEFVRVDGLTGGDTLYVDEEGLLKPQAHFFEFANYPQPLGGNGLIVGREVAEKATPAKTPVERLRELVRFKNRAQVDAWGKANASEPAASVTTVDGGRIHREVLSTYGRVIANIPKVEGDER